MFTIIFPVLNERLRLESGVTRTVEYLRKIAFEDYEIIIVDNGSEDETPQIAEMLCQKYEKVRYERINVRGVGAAFRRGVELSHGDVVGYMDIDLSTNIKHLGEAIHLFETQSQIEYTIQANMIIITENRIALTSIENFSRTLVKMISVSSARLLRVLRSSRFLALPAFFLFS